MKSIPVNRIRYCLGDPYAEIKKMRSFISCCHKYVKRLRDAAGTGKNRGSGIYSDGSG